MENQQANKYLLHLKIFQMVFLMMLVRFLLVVDLVQQLKVE